jgi:hypothetical protein
VNKKKAQKKKTPEESVPASTSADVAEDSQAGDPFTAEDDEVTLGSDLDSQHSDTDIDPPLQLALAPLELEVNPTDSFYNQEQAVETDGTKCIWKTPDQTKTYFNQHAIVYGKLLSRQSDHKYL